MLAYHHHVTVSGAVAGYLSGGVVSGNDPIGDLEFPTELADAGADAHPRPAPVERPQRRCLLPAARRLARARGRRPPHGVMLGLLLAAGDRFVMITNHSASATRLRERSPDRRH